MRKFSGSITSYVNNFEAESLVDAEAVIDGYIDRLAETEGLLTWDMCDAYTYEEAVA